MLWAIHELDRIDKHRLLLSVAVAVTDIGLDGDSYELAVVKKYSGMDESGPLLLELRQWTPVEEGVVLFGSPADFAATEATFFFDVTLSEPMMLRDKPAVTWLRLLADRAKTVITDLALPCLRRKTFLYMPGRVDATLPGGAFRAKKATDAQRRLSLAAGQS